LPAPSPASARRSLAASRVPNPPARSIARILGQPQWLARRLGAISLAPVAAYKPARAATRLGWEARWSANRRPRMRRVDSSSGWRPGRVMAFQARARVLVSKFGRAPLIRNGELLIPLGNPALGSAQPRYFRFVYSYPDCRFFARPSRMSRMFSRTCALTRAALASDWGRVSSRLPRRSVSSRYCRRHRSCCLRDRSHQRRRVPDTAGQQYPALRSESL
jgi:hypothetical protein